jgi:cysteine-rich repeat protein
MLRRGAITVLFLLASHGSSWSLTTLTGPEFPVNSYTTGTQLRPAVAADGAGNFVVVWTSGSEVTDPPNQDGSEGGIFGQRFDAAGARIGGEFQVNTYTTGPQDFPAVAMDAAGRFLVVWQSGASSSNGPDGSRAAIAGRWFDASGVPIGNEFVVNTYTTNFQTQAAVAASPTAGFVVVWQGPGFEGPDIRGQRFDDTGAPVGGEFLIDSYTTAPQLEPAVAMDPAGNFLVTWTRHTQFGNDQDVYGRLYDSTGAPTALPFRVNTYVTDQQRASSAAADGAGNFVVVWQSGGAFSYPDQDGGGGGIYAQRYDAAGTPQGAEFQVHAYTTDDQLVPKVAADAAGNFVVVWQSKGPDGSATAIAGRRFDATGVATSGEFVVNQVNTSYQFGPALAAGPAGNGLVAWASPEKDRQNSVWYTVPYGIRARRLTTACGDGVVDPGEECDDGGNADGDGCQGSCEVQECFTCTGSPSSCEPITQCGGGDGCCPSGCTAKTDTDCTALISASHLLVVDIVGHPNQLIAASKDAAIDTTVATGMNPVADGAYLFAYNTLAGFPTSVCIPLVTTGAAKWTARLDKAGNPVFRYTDKAATEGPCRSVIVRNGKRLRIICRESATIGFFLPVYEPSVTVRLTSGPHEYCMVFEGSAIKRFGAGVFDVGNVAAPVSCPSPPLFPCP